MFIIFLFVAFCNSEPCLYFSTGSRLCALLSWNALLLFILIQWQKFVTILFLLSSVCVCVLFVHCWCGVLCMFYFNFSLLNITSLILENKWISWREAGAGDEAHTYTANSTNEKLNNNNNKYIENRRLTPESTDQYQQHGADRLWSLLGAGKTL